MKKHLLFLVLTAFVISCSTLKEPISVDDKKAIKKEVNIILNDWHLAATEANFDNYFGKMTAFLCLLAQMLQKTGQKNSFQILANLILIKAKLGILKP